MASFIPSITSDVQLDNYFANNISTPAEIVGFSRIPMGGGLIKRQEDCIPASYVPCPTDDLLCCPVGDTCCMVDGSDVINWVGLLCS
jgi:hypothetical protein